MSREKHICGANTYCTPFCTNFSFLQKKNILAHYNYNQLLLNRATHYNLLFPITVVQSKSKTTVVLTTRVQHGGVEKILNLYKLEIQFK